MPASSDGVVSTTLLSDNTTQRITVDWTVAGSPIAGTAGNVSTTTVWVATSTAALATAGADGSAAWSVRSLTSVYAPGGSIVGVDHEAQFGSTLYYLAMAYNAAGVRLATSASVAVTPPVPTSGVAAWLKSLAFPSASVAIKPSAANTLEWASGIQQAVIPIMGRADPIVVQDARQYETAQLELITESLTEEAALKALLNLAGPYLLQLYGFGEPDRYVTVGPYSRRRLPGGLAADVQRAWTLPLIQVARPDPLGWQVADPGRTYADSTTAYPLYSNRTGTYRAKS